MKQSKMCFSKKDPAHHEHVRKIAKRRYDTDIYGS